jgi:hypothetical protein
MKDLNTLLQRTEALSFLSKNKRENMTKTKKFSNPKSTAIPQGLTIETRPQQQYEIQGGKK